MLNDNWYVYQHIRLDKNEIFYIGIGNKRNYARAFEFREDKRNNIWWRIYNKSEIKVEIVYENLSKFEASNREKELIKKIGRIDLNEGTLSNLTDGGDGIWNAIRSEHTRKLLSESKMGEKNHQFGKKQSSELIEKRFRNIKGSKRSEETKKRQSIGSIASGQAKKVNVYVYETNEFVGTFYAISEACRFLGFHSLNGKASLVANGKRRQVKGYVFKYVD
jgi:hypothetical protein